MQQPNIRVRLFLLGLGALFVGALYWFATHAFIEVSLPAGGQGSYSISQGDSGRGGEIQSGKVKKLVRRGSYEVVVTSGQDSFVTTVKAGGFLTTARTTAQLQPDNKRLFVAENPNTCMYPKGARLLSVACGDSFNYLKAHLPANAEQPPTVKPATGDSKGTIEGGREGATDTFVVVKESDGHYLLILDDDGSFMERVKLSQLNIGGDYTITAYKEGFVAYSEGSAVAYEDLRSTGTVLALQPGPKNKQAILTNVTTFGDTIAFVYTDNPDILPPSFDTATGEEAHSEEFEEATNQNKIPHTEVVMYREGKTLRYDFKVPAFGVSLCATNRLCTLNEGQLNVYNISGKKAKLLYGLDSIDGMTVSGNKVFLVRSTDIVVFDITTKTGYISYRFSNYAFCGLTPAASGYVVCIADTLGKRSALLVSLSEPNKDDIDYKLQELSKAAAIRTISVYGYVIHILPHVGEAEVNPETGEYEYDQGAIKSANKSIDKAIDRLGINREAYQIIFDIR